MSHPADPGPDQLAPTAAGSAAGEDRYVPPDLTGTGLSYRQEPVAYHGEEFEFVFPGRGVLIVPGRTWPARRPEECTSTELFEQIAGLLVGPGCGLDGT
jgi:hypothetical protein